jgi:hypothetical protein
MTRDATPTDDAESADSVSAPPLTLTRQTVSGDRWLWYMAWTLLWLCSGIFLFTQQRHDRDRLTYTVDSLSTVLEQQADSLQVETSERRALEAILDTIRSRPIVVRVTVPKSHVVVLPSTPTVVIQKK